MIDSWNMGSCMPAEIFGTDGFLARRQPDITTLELIADGSCALDGTPTPQECTLGLEHLRKLHRFTWLNIHKDAPETVHLARVLRTNAQHLQELTIGFTRQSIVEFTEHVLFLTTHRVDPATMAANEDENMATMLRHALYFPERTLECRISPSIRKLPALTSLALYNVNLKGHADEIVYHMNFQDLKTLRLTHCTGMGECLEAVIEAGVKPQLEVLDYDSYSLESISDARPMAEFLRSFIGLRDLFLFFQYDPRENKYTDYLKESIEQVARHASTLRRLVLHFVYPVTFHAPDFSVDMSDISEVLPTSPLSENPLLNLNLECLGISCSLECLVRT